jgi:hypothetical protein
MQTPNSLGIGDGKAPGFFVMFLLLIGLSLVYAIVYNKYKYKLNTGTLERDALNRDIEKKSGPPVFFPMLIGEKGDPHDEKY